MDSAEVIKELKSLATKDTRLTSKRRGVPNETVLGVSTRAIRKLAKKLGKDDELADQLWCEDAHEAHLLAILIAQLSEKTFDQLSRWAFDINSWDVCDQFAKRLSESLSNVDDLVSLWTHDETLYVRRAGLALIANHCMKCHELENDKRQCFTSLIEQSSRDDRQHIKQACCWALRELGKIDTETHEVATNLALELIEKGEPSSVWVGKCAYKELELLVKIPERRRLISRKSKTALEHHNSLAGLRT